jgi:multisubunit Na+/H+ antiporter MnhB subunit
VSIVSRFADALLLALAVLAAALPIAVISAAILGFTHAAMFIASVTAAALATRRAARLFQLPLM